MPEGKVILAVFDFDGTLTEGHLWQGIAKHHWTNKINRGRVLWYVFSHLPLWLASKIKLYPVDKNRGQWGKDLATLFKNSTIEEATAVFEWVTENYFMPRMKPDVLKVLKQHQEKGQRIILLSGMFVEFLEVVGQKLRIDDVVGTTLEVNGGQYTGKIIPPLCFGDNKANQLKGYIQKKAINVDLNGSFAYADSIYDNPVFRMVGHPVAVYPDKKLLKQAREKGWTVIDQERITSA